MWPGFLNTENPKLIHASAASTTTISQPAGFARLGRATGQTSGSTFRPSYDSSCVVIELNTYSERRCLARMDAVLRGYTKTLGQRMERDLEALVPLPSTPYEPCEGQATQDSSLSLVRYRSNDYSLPVAFGHREVVVKGYVDQVATCCGAVKHLLLCRLERRPPCLDLEIYPHLPQVSVRTTSA